MLLPSSPFRRSLTQRAYINRDGGAAGAEGATEIIGDNEAEAAAEALVEGRMPVVDEGVVPGNPE
jgi:hypothetical protein